MPNDETPGDTQANVERLSKRIESTPDDRATLEDIKELAGVITSLPQEAPRIDEELLREYGTEEQIGALYGALAAAAGDFKAVEKTGKVSFGNTKYNYAPLANLVHAVREPLAKQGLFCTQPFTMEDGAGVITSIVAHKGGGRLVSKLKFKANGDIKTLGGQTTYLGRYAMCRIFMLDGVDDADQFAEKTPSGAEPKQEGRRPRNQAPRPGGSKKAPAARRQEQAPPPEAGSDARAMEEVERKTRLRQAEERKANQAEEVPPPPSDEDAPQGEEPIAPAETVTVSDGATGVPMTKELGAMLKAEVGRTRIKAGVLGAKCKELTGEPMKKSMDGGHAASLLLWLRSIEDGAGTSL